MMIVRSAGFTKAAVYDQAGKQPQGKCEESRFCFMDKDCMGNWKHALVSSFCPPGCQTASPENDISRAIACLINRPAVMTLVVESEAENRSCVLSVSVLDFKRTCVISFRGSMDQPGCLVCPCPDAVFSGQSCGLTIKYE